MTPIYLIYNNGIYYGHVLDGDLNGVGESSNLIVQIGNELQTVEADRLNPDDCSRSNQYVVTAPHDGFLLMSEVATLNVTGAEVIGPAPENISMPTKSRGAVSNPNVAFGTTNVRNHGRKISLTPGAANRATGTQNLKPQPQPPQKTRRNFVEIVSGDTSKSVPVRTVDPADRDRERDTLIQQAENEIGKISVFLKPQTAGEIAAAQANKKEAEPDERYYRESLILNGKEIDVTIDRVARTISLNALVFNEHGHLVSGNDDVASLQKIALALLSAE